MLTNLQGLSFYNHHHMYCHEVITCFHSKRKLLLNWSSMFKADNKSVVKPLLCKISFSVVLAECCYILCIIFRIIPFTEKGLTGCQYCIPHQWQFYFSRYLNFFSVNENKIKILLTKVEKSFDIWVSPILHPRVNDLLFSYHFRTLEQ